MNVVFDEELYRPNPTNDSDTKPRFVRLLIKSGLAKDESQANIILLMAAGTLIVFSFFMLRGTARNAAKKLPHFPTPYSQEHRI